MDKLGRFNEAYKTILVVASLAWSTTLALERETMAPITAVYLLVFFVGAVAFSAYSTLQGMRQEYPLKTLSWWMLMTAFSLLIMHLTVPGSFALPPFLTAASSLLAFLLTLPIIRYFRDLMTAHELRVLNRALRVTLVLALTFDAVYYVLSLASL